MRGKVLLEARDLAVTRGGVEVLHLPSLVVAEGEVFALIGPNGAGKSTLLLALASLLPRSRGEVFWRGGEVGAGSPTSYRRRLAMVFQEPLLFDATVFDNVAAGLKIRGIGKSEREEKVKRTLDLFKILHLAGRSARKLSGGEAQRTSLARAFAVEPELILLDEPFAALDPPTRLGLTEELDRILSETGTAAILATHDQLEALRLADRMGVMQGGRIVQTGTPVEVMHRPADEFVARFVGMENLLGGEVVREGADIATVRVGGASIEMPGEAAPGDEVLFCIRPEHVTITTADPGGATSARNVFPGVIEGLAPMGAYQKVSLDCGFPLVAFLTSQSIASLHLGEGVKVFASFKATAVHVIRVGKP